MAELDLSKPIIWTSQGNMNECDLDYRTGWGMQDDSILFAEEYYLKGTTELVKRSVHVFKPQGASLEPAQAGMR
jgi:hypothetical protein